MVDKLAFILRSGSILYFSSPEIPCFCHTVVKKKISCDVAFTVPLFEREVVLVQAGSLTCSEGL